MFFGLAGRSMLLICVLAVLMAISTALCICSCAKPPEKPIIIYGIPFTSSTPVSELEKLTEYGFKKTEDAPSGKRQIVVYNSENASLRAYYESNKITYLYLFWENGLEYPDENLSEKESKIWVEKLNRKLSALKTDWNKPEDGITIGMARKGAEGALKSAEFNIQDEATFEEQSTQALYTSATEKNNVALLIYDTNKDVYLALSFNQEEATKLRQRMNIAKKTAENPLD